MPGTSEKISQPDALRAAAKSEAERSLDAANSELVSARAELEHAEDQLPRLATVTRLLNLAAVFAGGRGGRGVFPLRTPPTAAP